MTPELFTNPDNPAEAEPSHRPLTPEQADKLPHIHRLLLKHYGRPPARTPWDPLTQFIYSLLSSRTKTAQSLQVMRDLERAFPGAGPGNWEPVRDASVAEIERAIAIVTFPEQKALRLKTALEQFEGVGPQVSAAIVNFSTLRRRALSIDANHLRVVQRLCVVPRADAATTEERLMRLVPETWDAAMLDEHHTLVKLHAQTLCTFENPRCPDCPLLQICPTGQRNVSELHLTPQS